MFRRALVVSATFLLAGACGEKSQTPAAVNVTDGSPDTSLTPTVAQTAPNYSEREGDTYMYVSAVSDEDKQKGKATGDVIMYRYLGFEDGKHRIASVDDAGNITGRNECSDPCRIIKSNYGGVVDRIPYNEGSIIGSAFADAINGHLQVAKSARRPDATPVGKVEAARIPKLFQGEWNSDLSACGTGLSDSRLRISATRLQFYESTGEVQAVRVENWRVITVNAAFSGEGQTWNKEVRLALTGPANGVTIDGLLRHKCP